MTIAAQEIPYGPDNIDWTDRAHRDYQTDVLHFGQECDWCHRRYTGDPSRKVCRACLRSIPS